MENEQTSASKLILVVIVLAVAIVAIWWFGFGRKTSENNNVFLPTPSPRQEVKIADVILPKDLRVLSGRVTGKLAAGMVVEWSIPKRTDLKEIEKQAKNISWTKDTVFERVDIGSPGAAPEKIKSSDVRVGQSVMVATISPVQSSDNLEAEKVQVLVLPKL